MFPHFDDDQHEQAGGHYRTGGYAIAGLGLVCFIIGLVVTAVAGFDIGFIDGPTMMLFSAAFIATGGTMVWSGRSREEP